MASETISQPNAKTFTPEEIVTEVLAGRVRVPSFQRSYRWQWEDVRRLFDSIAKGYPIGNLLLWSRSAPAERIQLGALKISGERGSALYVVDGQQRITSLANALTDEGANDPRFALAYDLKDPNFRKIQQDAPAHIVPLPVIFDLQRLITWFADHPELDRVLLNRASQLAKVIRQYAIPAYVVTQQEEQILRDIFDRMNNYGRRLSRAEVFAALHGQTSKAGSNINFSKLAEAVNAATGFGRIDDDTVLRAFLARRGGDVSRDIRQEFSEGVERDFGGESTDDAYDGAEDALISAVQFLQKFAGVPHFGFLPYRYLLVVLTRYFAHHPKPSARNRTLLRRFFWRAALAGPMLHGAWTSTMRALATKITPKDASGSVQRLLDAVDQRMRGLPRLTHFRTNTAETRVFLCALWSRGPISPIDGGSYDIDGITQSLGDETRATNALKTFFHSPPDTYRAWAANRAIVPEDVGDDVVVAFVRGPSEFNVSIQAKILASHALDIQMITMLEAGDAVSFLEARQEKLTQVLRDFLEKMTETKFEDTPPLDELDMDDDESRDDALDA
ncbi:GmrSD restriction endonuclease domain-containing protein [Polyangium spumosum]|uniref:DUF262 domain-containing protein n=1 Tax=Polyangium spumosum TaxID=889282 RepID=A0A6N7PX67_9BACT|nr:DUF262 domain-containing protein [Polyangium spumosum]